MPELIYTNWRNNNERVRYPFQDNTSLRSTNDIVFPQDLFDDARLYIIGAGPDMHMSRVSLSVSLVQIFFADDSNEMASASFDPASPPDNLDVIDNFGRPAGILVSSAQRLSSLFGIFPPGDSIFESETTRFAASVVVPMPHVGVRAITTEDGGFHANEVWLVGTDGIVLSVEDGSIRVDVVGDPYALLRACEEDDVPVDPLCGIKTINGIGPDENGDFKLTIGSNEALQNVLRIEQDGSIDTVLKSVTAKGCGNA